jgi:hypothetical protein
MAGVAVNITERVLRENGPFILRTPYWEKNTGKDKFTNKNRPPGWLPRLQSAAGPHKKGADPHIAGRALDIILFANHPSERELAEAIVKVFLDLRPKMGWVSVIYNGSEWYSNGTKHPRGGGPENRHVTHIHIEWGQTSVLNGKFEADLISRMTALAENENVKPETFEIN